MRIAFVCVNYFSSELLEPLVTSLQKEMNDSWELVVVDNSEDAGQLVTLRAVASRDSRIRVVRANRNVGYLNALPLALPALQQPDFAWMALLNMDVTLSSFEVGAAARFQDNRIGVIAPAVVSSRTGADQNPYLTARPSRRTVLRWQLAFRVWWVARLWVYFSDQKGSSRRGTSQPLVVAGPPRAVYAPHGSCFFLSRQYLEAGGAISQPVDLFCEEITVAESARRLGLVVMHDPLIRFEHQEHATTKVWRSRRLLEMQSAALRYAMGLLYGGRP